MSNIENRLSHRKIGLKWLENGLPQWMEKKGANPVDMERFFYGLNGICAVAFKKLLTITQQDQQQDVLALPWKKHGLILNLSGQTNTSVGLQSCDLQKVTANVGFGAPHGELVRPLAFRDLQILTADDPRYASISLSDFGITRFERGRLATAPAVPEKPQGRSLAPSVPVQPGLSQKEIDAQIKKFELEEKKRQDAEARRIARKAATKAA